MKNYIPEINYAPEWKNTWANPVVTDTATKTWEVLDTVELKMQSRNLDYAEVGADLVNQLREYVEKSGVNSMVMWVSGWVDSGLVSTLAAKTGLPLTVIEMPIHQAKDQVDNAQEHIAWLIENFPNVAAVRVDLTETFEKMKAALPEIENEEVVRYMAYVNTRSRLRGNVLYAVANEKNGIVLGTGNKVEDYGIWFFTKFGDGAVDLSPIGNLYKSEVRALARELWVPENISEAVATDGLHNSWATDEDQIGCSYDELEWAMVEVDEYKNYTAESYISWKSPDTIESFIAQYTGREKDVLEIYLKRHLENAHKMEMPPVFELKI